MLTTKNKTIMKKTTLLIIGALAFVLQNATAQPYTIYSQDFENQGIGDTPVNQDNNTLWSWAGNAGGSTWDVESVSSGEYSTQAAVFSWAITDTTSWGTGYSTGDGIAYYAGDGNALSDLNFSVDLASISGDTSATIWILEKQGNNGQVWAGQYNCTLNTDGSWTHVAFTLDQLVIQEPGPGNSNIYSDYSGNLQLEIDVDGGGNYALGTDTIWMDNFLLTANNPIPEPGTIALVTLGGLGALVAIRRRRA
jgi:hypothetical protein